MRRSFLSFTRSQRIGIISLIVLILLAFAINFFLTNKKEHLTETDDDLKEIISQFQKDLREKEKEKRLKYPPYNKNKYNKRDYSEKESKDYELFDFDPNSVDSITLTRLGLSPFIINNIIKYRNKGGSFKTKEQFKRLYGLTDVKYQELEPFIQINPIPKNEAWRDRDKNTDSTAFKQRYTTKKRSYLDPGFIAPDINRADTTELLTIVGIGPYYAKQIIYYRNRLGGYYSVEQLREIHNMTDDNFEKIKHSLTAHGDSIRKLKINFASIERLKAHPYINTFIKAKAIDDLRKSKVKIKSVDDLKELNIFTDEELLKLTPYLDFK